MDIYKNIIIGIITGILTSALIWLLIVTFRKIIIPWYQSIVYKGIDLDGNWLGDEYRQGDGYKYPDKLEHYLTINQKGHKVSGTLAIKNLFEVEKKNFTSEYIFTGEISDNCLLLSYERKTRNKLGMGSYLLKVTGSGDFLVGNSIFINYEGDIKSTDDIVLERNNN